MISFSLIFFSFISSFVRENLKYDVMPKGPRSLFKLVDRMKALYPGKSGIVYCLSRSTILNFLRIYQIKLKFF